MFLKMNDFISGMGKDFALEAMGIAEKLSHDAAHCLFKTGEPADHFYVLVKGSVELRLGETGPVVYQAIHPGEVIGWSSLVGRDSFSASAKCAEAAQLLRFDRDRFLDIVTKNPANEALLYRRLSVMLGNRLLQLYPTLT